MHKPEPSAKGTSVCGAVSTQIWKNASSCFVHMTDCESGLLTEARWGGEARLH